MENATDAKEPRTGTSFRGYIEGRSQDGETFATEGKIRLSGSYVEIVDDKGDTWIFPWTRIDYIQVLPGVDI